MRYLKSDIDDLAVVAEDLLKARQLINTSRHGTADKHLKAAYALLQNIIDQASVREVLKQIEN